MPAFRPNRIAAPEVLKNLSRANLLRLLAPYAEHFKGIDMPPADRADDETLEYRFAHLADRLLDTDPPPPQDLAKALFFIHHCATEEGEEEIHTALRARAAQENNTSGNPEGHERDRHLPPGRNSRADTALHAWLLDPSILETIYPLLKMADPKSAVTYPAKTDPLPVLRLDRVKALEAHLDKWYQDEKRRCEGTEIAHRAIDDNEHHFVIKRPDSFQRQGMMQKKAPDEFGFPERFDLVVVRANPPEMVIVARPKGIREKYRETFADYLYGDPVLFEGVDKYTLAPLADARNAYLSPPPDTALEGIKLVLTHHVFGPKSSLTRQDPDIVAAMGREKGAVHLPSFAPKRAKFALYFKGEVGPGDEPRPVFLEIEPPHTCRYSRHCDTDLVDVWLAEGKFLVERPAN